MTNNSGNKLENKIKESLTDFEKLEHPRDWEKMEQLLESVPTAVNGSRNYLLYSLIGVLIFVGGYLFYSNSNESSSKKENIILKPETIKPTKPNPIIESPTLPAANKVESVSETIGDANKNKQIVHKTEVEKFKNVKSSEKKNPNNEQENKIEKIKPDHIMVMGSEPIFGDMLDSSKGIIGRTKESSELKKSAVKQADKPIGWDKFIEKAMDSLKNSPPKNP